LSEWISRECQQGTKSLKFACVYTGEWKSGNSLHMELRIAVYGDFDFEPVVAPVTVAAVAPPQSLGAVLTYVDGMLGPK